MAPADSEGLPGDAAARYRRAGWWTGQRLADRFESHVAESPDDPALVSGRDSLSRADLWNAAGDAARRIRAVVRIQLAEAASRGLIPVGHVTAL